MEHDNPLISIIVVNWNGKRFLKACFDAIYRQTYENFEVILVDNASDDGSIEFVTQNYEEVVILPNSKNLGFAGGNNAGFKVAKGEYIFLLNNDTDMGSNVLEETLKAFDEYPMVAAVQPKLVMMNDHDTLDSCGSFWTTTTVLYHYGMAKNVRLKKYNAPLYVFSNKGAALMLRKDIIDEIGLFDDDQWCYYEETDLCHRIWIYGYECLYYPKSTVRHTIGASSNRIARASTLYHSFANKFASYLVNFEILTLLSVIPTHLIVVCFSSLIWLVQGKFGFAYAAIKSVFKTVTNLKTILAKRKRVQSIRRRSDADLFELTKVNPKLRYYLLFFFKEYDGMRLYVDCDL